MIQKNTLGLVFVLIAHLFLIACGEPEPQFRLAKVGISAQAGRLLIEDGNYGVRYKLPDEWSQNMSPDLLVSESWKIAFMSKDRSMAMRFAVHPGEKTPLPYFFANYLRKAVGAQKKERITEIVKKMKRFNDADLKTFNVDNGYFVNITYNAKTAGDFWGREHLMVFKRGNDIFIIDLFAKQTFFDVLPDASSAERQRKFESLNNPIFTLFTSLKFKN